MLIVAFQTLFARASQLLDFLLFASAVPRSDDTNELANGDAKYIASRSCLRRDHP